jgi:membrane-bound inhibitor of C-type lysozyme
MKRYVTSSSLAMGVAMALTLQSCVTAQQNNPSPAVSPAAEASASPAVDPSSPTEPTWAETAVIFTCANGETFSAEFSNEQAIVALGDRELTLPQVVSASGARYSDGETTLHTKGNEAFVEAAGQIILEDCVAETTESSHSEAIPVSFEINQFTADFEDVFGCETIAKH